MPDSRKWEKACAGGFVFYWGERDEQSSTYWGLLHENRATDSVGALASVWGGDISEKQPLELKKPNIEGLNGAKIEKGKLYYPKNNSGDKMRSPDPPFGVSGRATV